MTSRIYTAWKCDRCSLTTQTELKESQPMGWVRIMVTIPPLASPVEAKVVNDGHLCPGCAQQLKDWWNKP